MEVACYFVVAHTSSSSSSRCQRDPSRAVNLRACSSSHLSQAITQLYYSFSISPSPQWSRRTNHLSPRKMITLRCDWRKSIAKAAVNSERKAWVAYRADMGIFERPIAAAGSFKVGQAVIYWEIVAGRGWYRMKMGSHKDWQRRIHVPTHFFITSFVAFLGIGNPCN